MNLPSFLLLLDDEGEEFDGGSEDLRSGRDRLCCLKVLEGVEDLLRDVELQACQLPGGHKTSGLERTEEVFLTYTVNFVNGYLIVLSNFEVIGTIYLLLSIFLDIMHKMKLLADPFQKIKAGNKTVEIRLNDKKRQLVKVGDTIEFSKLPELKESLRVEVVGLFRYSNFKEMINDLGLEVFGYPANYSKDEFVRLIYSIYSPDQEKEHGVLAIQVQLNKINEILDS